MTTFKAYAEAHRMCFEDDDRTWHGGEIADQWLIALGGKACGLDGPTSDRLSTYPVGRRGRAGDVGEPPVIASDGYMEALAFEELVAIRWTGPGAGEPMMAPLRRSWGVVAERPTTLEALFARTGDAWRGVGAPEAAPLAMGRGTWDGMASLLAAAAGLLGPVQEGSVVRVDCRNPLRRTPWGAGASMQPNPHKLHPRWKEVNALLAAIAKWHDPVEGKWSEGSRQANRESGWVPVVSRRDVSLGGAASSTLRLAEAATGRARANLAAWVASEAPGHAATIR